MSLLFHVIIYATETIYSRNIVIKHMIHTLLEFQSYSEELPKVSVLVTENAAPLQ